jgi:hypothetical protein
VVAGLVVFLRELDSGMGIFYSQERAQPLWG